MSVWASDLERLRDDIEGALQADNRTGYRGLLDDIMGEVSIALRAAERRAYERAAAVAQDPKHGLSAWRARENIARAILSLSSEETGVDQK